MFATHLLRTQQEKIFPEQVNTTTELLSSKCRICWRLVLGQEQGESCVHHCCGRSRSGRKGDSCFTSGTRPSSSSHHSPHLKQRCNGCTHSLTRDSPSLLKPAGCLVVPGSGKCHQGQPCPAAPQPGVTPGLHKSHTAIPVPLATAQDFLGAELLKPPVD